MNPAAFRKDLEPRGLSVMAVFGTLLLLMGVLAATLGTFLCWLGTAFTRQDESLAVWLALVWAGGSVAFLFAGGLLLRAGSRPGARIARTMGLFLLLALVGLCGWIFVMTVCLS
jgi:hypothetical protein